jgi:hypothetical protein
VTWCPWTQDFCLVFTGITIFTLRAMGRHRRTTSMQSKVGLSGECGSCTSTSPAGNQAVLNAGIS